MDSKLGHFIVFEGLDGIGKTTQLALLREKMFQQKMDAEVLSFPDRTTPVGRILNEFLTLKNSAIQHRAAHLLFSANRWEVQHKIHELLERGVTVLCDRYAYSGIVYSVAALGLDRSWCRSSDEGLIAPHIVVFLDSHGKSVEQRLESRAECPERYESQNIQKKVYEEYLALIGPNWVLIDAYEGTIDEVHDAIWRKLEPRLKFGAETPKLLWNSDGGKSVDDQ